MSLDVSIHRFDKNDPRSPKELVDASLKIDDFFYTDDLNHLHMIEDFLGLKSNYILEYIQENVDKLDYQDDNYDYSKEYFITETDSYKYLISATN